MTFDDARTVIEAAGARTLESRGFYSHFLRIWYPADARTSLTTINFTKRGNLPSPSVLKALRTIAAIDPATVERRTP